MPGEILEKIESGPQLTASELTRLQRAALLIALLFIVAAACFGTIAQSAPNPLLAGIGSFFAWCSIVGAIHYFFFRSAVRDRRNLEYNRELEKRESIGSSDPTVSATPFLPDFASRWQWVILVCGLMIGFAVFRDSAGGALGNAQRSVLQMIAVIALASGCMLFFLRQFADAIQSRLKTAALDGLLHLTHIAFWVSLATAAVVFIDLMTTRDFGALLGWPLLALTIVLAAETLVRFGARFYQPVALRDVSTPAGTSLFLDAGFGHGKGWRAAVASFENLVGAKVSELWFFEFVRGIAVPMLLATGALVWFSTCFTAVPAGSRGVEILLGKYLPIPLQPGLHFTWPRPFADVQIIPTELVRSVSLGFDKDLSGPVLWTEKHAEGEKNLLVGNGESLLTINVPIFYRIADPVAFLQTTNDPDEALASLAERKLIQITGSRDSFAIMTTERAAITTQLKTVLQSEVDRLGLGLQILFVGMKDIHPPVDVAPAYEEVVSAEEQKESMIDIARAYRADTMPAAKAQATREKVTADADAKQRVAQAEGETSQFLAVAKSEEENPALFRARIRLDTLQDALVKPTKVILDGPAAAHDQVYLDLRNTSDLPPP